MSAANQADSGEVVPTLTSWGAMAGLDVKISSSSAGNRVDRRREIWLHCDRVLSYRSTEGRLSSIGLSFGSDCEAKFL